MYPLISKIMSSCYHYLRKKEIVDIATQLDENAFQSLINSKDHETHLSNLRTYCEKSQEGNNAHASPRVVSINEFQETIRKNRLIIENSTKLIGFDISRTLITYHSNATQKEKASQTIKCYLSGQNIHVSAEEITHAITFGMDEYSAIRERNGIEEEQLLVYKQYIIPKINGCNCLTDAQIEKIIKIWKEESVSITLTCPEIFDLVAELKRRKITVVTISDMLGDMSFYAMKKTGILSIFDAHFCSNDYGRRKKNCSQSLFDCVTYCTGIQPEYSFMIGNNEQDDIIPAHNRGWKTIFVKFENDDSLFADYNISKTRDLMDLLNTNKIEGIKTIKTTKYLENTSATTTDSGIVQLQYRLRSIISREPNRDLRTDYYRKYLLSYLGNGSRLGQNFEVRYPQNIYIGDNCQINDNVTILNEGIVLIGNDVMIACNVFVSTHIHLWRIGLSQDNVETRLKGNTCCGIVSIESNTWIGPYVSIEPNTFIGDHCIIAAHSHVKSGIYPSYSFIAGSPALIKRSIKDEVIGTKKSFIDPFVNINP